MVKYTPVQIAENNFINNIIERNENRPINPYNKLYKCCPIVIDFAFELIGIVEKTFFILIFFNKSIN